MADKKKSDKEHSQVPAEVSRELEEVMRRLRLLEERYLGLRKKSQFTEQNMIKDSKEIFDEITIINETVTEIKSDISELNEKFMKLIEEVRSSVKKSEFNVLAKYIEYWEPLNFVTKEQAEKLIKEK